MDKCVHVFAPKLVCDMVVMTYDVNERITRNTDSLKDLFWGLHFNNSSVMFI